LSISGISDVDSHGTQIRLVRQSGGAVDKESDLEKSCGACVPDSGNGRGDFMVRCTPGLTP